MSVVSGPEILAEVRRLVMHHLRGCNAKVYLFGSRASGTPHASSDVDVAVLPLSPLPVHLLSAIRESLEDSVIPCSVDLIDLSLADPDFRSRVEREGVLWID